MYKNIMNDLGQLRTVVSKSYIYNLIQNQTGLSIRTISHVLNHTLEQTNVLQNGLNQGLANNREQATSQFNILSAKLDAQTVMINDKFCQLEMREMQNTIAQLREEKAALTASALSQQQTQNIVGQLRPTAVPAYPSCSPYQAYTWGQVFGGGCCNNGCGCNNGCCNNNAAV